MGWPGLLRRKIDERTVSTARSLASAETLYCGLLGLYLNFESLLLHLVLIIAAWYEELRGRWLGLRVANLRRCWRYLRDAVHLPFARNGGR